MNIAFYHPNMHLMGGGETVCLTLASALQNTHNITIFVTRPVDIQKYEHFFDLPLNNITFTVVGTSILKIPSLNTYKPSILLRSLYTTLNKFDLVIDTCSNGLFDKKLKPKTIAYIHFPNYTQQKKGWKSLFNFLLINEKNMFTYDHIICNSGFTKSQVEQLTNRNIDVIHPPVKTEKIQAKKKKKMITSIGRFSPEKKFETIINAFILLEKKTPSYSLHLIGAYNDKFDNEYYTKLQHLAKGHNITFHKNMPHKDVLDFLSSSMFYWHARGFGETDPVEYENFGITTVEAMSAGCIPVVINLGAQPEIVHNKKYIWSTIPQLVDKTIALEKISKKEKTEIIQRAKSYSTKKFLDSVYSVLFDTSE